MSTICVIGGTRYFGKIAVRNLLDLGHSVTILTRGRSGDDFGAAVDRITADANDVASLSKAVADHEFDTVVHQMCYSPLAAQAAVEAFTARSKRLVMTSTIEVYNRDTFRDRPPPEMSQFALERELDTSSYGYDLSLPWLEEDFADRNYAEGRRQAECLMAERALFPVAFVRVAHVLAEQDEFTGRFRFHVERILRGQRIASFRSPGVTSFVHANDMGAFLAWMTQSSLTGPVNASSHDGANVYDICAEIARAAGTEAWIEEVDDPRHDPDLSPFSFPADFAMSSSLATDAGFTFSTVSDWLPRLAASYVDTVERETS